MKKYIFATLLGLATISGLDSCDDGPIQENAITFKEGRVVKLTGILTGLANWPDEYSVAVAGFDGTDEYAVISKALPKNEEGKVEVVLSGISDEVTNVQLCVLDRLRRHVMTFQQMDLEQTRDTMYMDTGTINVSMFNAIQLSYFSTTCANCHGASNRAAAGLYLTEGKSYDALVGQPSKKIDGVNLVEPGDAENSLLHTILHSEIVEGITMTHRDLVSEKNDQSILPLIDSWINNGAKNN
ncbi:MAG: hypothetical protein IJ159_03205 [Prevotella sp.]|nr:hypothetical protein [Prevotella sp.]